jgi:N-alpha-acetyltransferase 38, NatC auxiliary subunit
VLAHTFEYRLPQPASGAGLTVAAGSSAATTAYDIDKTARYLGLVVVPGEHIVAIAVEQKNLSGGMTGILRR